MDNIEYDIAGMAGLEPLECFTLPVRSHASSDQVGLSVADILAFVEEPL